MSIPSLFSLVPFLLVGLVDLSLLARYALRLGRTTPERDHVPVSVVIPAYNAQDTIGDTLASVLSEECAEVIVVDDGSTDGTLEVCRNAGDGRLTVATGDHRGKWSALNKGVSLASNGRIVIVDADTTVDGGSISRLASGLVRFDAVAGNLGVKADGSLMGALQGQEHLRISMHRRADGDVGTISGPFAAFRKEVLVREPFMDSVVEDFEHTLRIRRSGARIGYEPEARAITRMPGRFSEYLEQRMRWTCGTLKEMRRNCVPISGLLKGYAIATLDVALLPVAIAFGQYMPLFLVFVLEAVLQMAGAYREGTRSYLGSLLFFPQLIFLALMFLSLNVHAIARCQGD